MNRKTLENYKMLPNLSPVPLPIYAVVDKQWVAIS